MWNLQKAFSLRTIKVCRFEIIDGVKYVYCIKHAYKFLLREQVGFAAVLWRLRQCVLVMILYAIALFEYVDCRQRGNLAADRVYRETNFVLSLIKINRAFCERGFHFFLWQTSYRNINFQFSRLVSLLKLKTIHKCVLCPYKRQI